MNGRVSLIGAGPGDPDLLTLRAARRLAEADVVLYDALVDQRVLELAPRARRVDVGKRCGNCLLYTSSTRNTPFHTTRHAIRTPASVLLLGRIGL